MKISPLFFAHERKFANNKVVKNQNYTQNAIGASLPVAYPSNYYFLNFEGVRVGKDLDSFIERNKENLPLSVKAYIDNLSDEKRLTTTPLQAHRGAFEYLLICDSVKDVKDAYPDEPLFSNLKEVGENKTKRGLLFDIRLMREDLASSGETLFQDGNDNLTVYLLRKIFLEGATIAEINDDLDKNINPAFKREDKNYILRSTLEALGIELPAPYLNSLRYTREGYSDTVGDIISKHWAGLSQSQKDEIKKSHAPRVYTKEQRDKLKKAALKHWSEMTPEQKAEQLSKMQAGADPKQKFTMIAAWNELPEVREKLSEYLLLHHFYAPQNVIYRTESKSESMRRVMDKFWSENPSFADEFGKMQIEMAEKYDIAKEEGSLDEFIKSTLDKQLEVKAQIKKLSKIKKDELLDYNPTVEDYRKSFSFLPDDLLDLHSEKLKQLDKKDAEIFVRYCKNEPLNNAQRKTAQRVGQTVMQERTLGYFAFLISYFNEVEKMFKPIVNEKTGEQYHPHLPGNFTENCIDLIKLCYKLQNSDGSVVKFSDFFPCFDDSGKKIPACLYNEATVSACLSGQIPIKPISQKAIKIMKNYHYEIIGVPDFDAAKARFEKIAFEKPSVKDTRRLAVKLCGIDADKKVIDKIDERLKRRNDYYWAFVDPEIMRGTKMRVMAKMFGWHSNDVISTKETTRNIDEIIDNFKFFSNLSE